MFPNQGNPAPQQTGPFGVPLGPNGQQQILAPQMNGQPQQQFNAQPQQQFNAQPQQVPQYAPQQPDTRFSFPTSALPQQQPPAPAGFQGQQQQAVPQVQQPVPQQQAPAGLAPNTILSGPNVPPELQGRTWAEAVGIYQGMRDVVLRNAQVPQQQTPRVADAPAQQQVPTAQATPDFWKDPNAAMARAAEQAVQRVVAPMLAPMVQQNAQAAYHTALQTVAAEFGDFQAYAPQVLASLRDADPSMLGNAELIRTAYFVAKGRAGAFQHQPGGLPSQQQRQIPQQPGYPQQQIQQGYNPIPNLNTFYSEPSGRQGQNGAGPVALTPQQAYAADKMGMSHADYAAWSGGMGR